MALGVVAHNFSFLTAANRQMIRDDVQTYSATYAVQYEVDIAITATPTAYAVNGVIGATPVALYLFNPLAVAVTMAGNQIVAITVPAGASMFLPAFSTTGQLTLNTASGTGSVYVLLMK